MRKTVLFSFFLFMSSFSHGQSLQQQEEEADVFMEKEEFEKALSRYTLLLEGGKLSEQATYNVLYKRAVCHFRTGNFEEALNDIDDFVEVLPHVPQPHLLRAFIYGEMGDVESQLKSLNTLVDLDPLNPELLKWQGSLLLEIEDYGQAREKLKLAGALKNDHEVELYLGLTYYHQNDPDSALYRFEKAIELDETYVVAYIYAGSLCIQQEAYPLALTFLNKALTYEPTDPDILFYKGVAYVEMEKEEEGCRYIKKAFHGGYDPAAGYLEEYCYK